MLILTLNLQIQNHLSRKIIIKSFYQLSRKQNKYKTMQDFQLTQSIVKEQQKNQFLDQNFTYQKCPHCQRKFFLGKLKYHLKLCKPNNPMTKSPIRKTKRSYLLTALQKNQNLQSQQLGQSPRSTYSPEIKFKKCQFCKATFPLSAIDKHQNKCNFKPSVLQKQQQESPQYELHKLKSKTKIDFEFKLNKQFNKDQIKQPSSALPRIRNIGKQRKEIQRKYISQDLKQLSKNYTVRIRQELSCFKKALQVQQIQCPYCSRKFSKQASLRHIPICQKLKNQQMHQIILKKNSKSQIYKLSIPIKKNTLFRNKFKSELMKQKSEQLESKSARIFQVQKIKRQEGNKTTLTATKRKIKNISSSNNKNKNLTVDIVKDNNNRRIQKQNFQIQKEKINKQLADKQKTQQYQEQPYEKVQEANKSTIPVNQQLNNMTMTFSKNFNKSAQNIDKKTIQIQNSIKIQQFINPQSHQSYKKDEKLIQNSRVSSLKDHQIGLITSSYMKKSPENKSVQKYEMQNLQFQSNESQQQGQLNEFLQHKQMQTKYFNKNQINDIYPVQSKLADANFKDQTNQNKQQSYDQDFQV